VRPTQTSEKGRQEAWEPSVVLKNEGYIFDVAFNVRTQSAIRPFWTVLDESDLVRITVHRSWLLQFEDGN
jgi:bisphosphoglycerate-dependent phosphoglycerate mutase